MLLKIIVHAYFIIKFEFKVIKEIVYQQKNIKYMTHIKFRTLLLCYNVKKKL